MSDFPPTADFFAPHVAASAYRPHAWVSSNVDRPAADPPNNACGPVPPPANLSTVPPAGEPVYPLSDELHHTGKHEIDAELEEMTHAELVDLIESTPDPDTLADLILDRLGPPF